MTESLFASLLGMCDKHCLDRIAGALGEPNQSVFRGIQSSLGAVLGSVGSRAGDPGAIRRTLDMAPRNGVEWSHFAETVPDPNSPSIAAGKRILPGLLGPSEAAIAEGIAKDADLRPETARTLLAMAAPIVLNFLDRLVQDGLSLSGLSSVLQRESTTVRNALAPGIAHLIWPQPAVAAGPIPIGRTARSNGGFPLWLPIAGACVLGLSLWWQMSPARKAISERMTPLGTASRTAGDFVDRRLPNGFILSVPAKGTESRLLIVMGEEKAKLSKKPLALDRVTFKPQSSNLFPESREQIDNLAVMLSAYPSVKMEVAGYSDDTGNTAQNQTLAQSRAEAVKDALVSKGIAPDRVMTKAYKQNASEAGNGGAAVKVLEK